LYSTLSFPLSTPFHFVPYFIPLSSIMRSSADYMQQIQAGHFSAD
jgi:hypothetical protein